MIDDIINPIESQKRSEFGLDSIPPSRERKRKCG
jgi:hypothetical protein